MAKDRKKKKKGGAQQIHLSPERYIREMARTLPIGKCFINPHWKEDGMASIVVTRVRPSGNLVLANYLVDTYCLGVKDTAYYHNFTPYDFVFFLDGCNLEEISYNEVHNIIYGAIAWAEEGGVEPCRDFNVTQYVLEEDTDEVPLIEYEFGKDGKHLLISTGNYDDQRYVATLKQHLGDDFQYIVPAEDFDDEYIDGDDLFDDDDEGDSFEEDDDDKEQ